MGVGKTERLGINTSRFGKGRRVDETNERIIRKLRIKGGKMRKQGDRWTIDVTPLINDAIEATGIGGATEAPPGDTDIIADLDDGSKFSSIHKKTVSINGENQECYEIRSFEAPTEGMRVEAYDEASLFDWGSISTQPKQKMAFRLEDSNGNATLEFGSFNPLPNGDNYFRSLEWVPGSNAWRAGNLSVVGGVASAATNPINVVTGMSRDATDHLKINFSQAVLTMPDALPGDATLAPSVATGSKRSSVMKETFTISGVTYTAYALHNFKTPASTPILVSGDSAWSTEKGLQKVAIRKETTGGNATLEFCAFNPVPAGTSANRLLVWNDTTKGYEAYGLAPVSNSALGAFVSGASVITSVSIDATDRSKIITTSRTLTFPSDSGGFPTTYEEEVLNIVCDDGIKKRKVWVQKDSANPAEHDNITTWSTSENRLLLGVSSGVLRLTKGYLKT